MKKRARQAGAALITVLVAVMIVTILILEFQYSAMVELKLAYNDLNQTQAYYLAKSGARMGYLRLVLFRELKNSTQLKSMLQAANIPAAALDPYLDQVWQLPIPPFPPDPSLMQKMVKADKDAAAEALKDTKITEGSYSVTIKSESSKINLNSLIVPANMQGQRPNFRTTPKTPYMFAGVQLVNLLDGFMKASDNPYEEYPDLRPEELVTDIMDWVSPGDTRLMGGNKDSFYESQKPPYKAKRNRFFTLEELRLVKGIDGKLFDKLRPYVTVYSYDGKINVNNADGEVFKALYNDFTDDDIKKILEWRSQHGNWPSAASFAQYISQTLGRPGFTQVYNDPNNYPFGVDTKSFLIEALGEIKKSASSVQRRVTLAVAFGGGAGGQLVQGVTTAADCQKDPNQFWYQAPQQCWTKPTNQTECENSFAGAKFSPSTTPNNPGVCNLMGYNSKQTVNVVNQSNSATLKVLHWSES